MWGTRASKYKRLFELDIDKTDWIDLTPNSPFYLFSPQNIDLLGEYLQGWKVTEIYPKNSVGIVTARDGLTIQWTKNDVWETVKEFSDLPIEEARTKYNLGQDARDWKVHFAQADLKAGDVNFEKITPILYRPFDQRFTYYTGQSRGFICMPRPEIMYQFLEVRPKSSRFSGVGSTLHNSPNEE